jgi:hypothetical protein
MLATIGRIVIYKLTEADKNALRHFNCNTPEELPAIVVSVWSESCINVKVIVDGSIPDLWKTSVNLGDQQGNWRWPEIKR